MPLFIAPALAHGAAQPRLLVGTRDDRARQLAGEIGKQHARFHFQMRKGPDRRRCGDAEGPHFAAGFVAEHGGAAVALAAPGYPRADFGLIVADMKARLLPRKLITDEAECLSVNFPSTADHGDEVIGGFALRKANTAHTG